MGLSRASHSGRRDEPSISEVLRYTWRAGYKVIAVPDGEAALNALAVQLTALVVLDLMLPKVDGYEIAPLVTQRGRPHPSSCGESEQGSQPDRRPGNGCG